MTSHDKLWSLQVLPCSRSAPVTVATGAPVTVGAGVVGGDLGFGPDPCNGLRSRVGLFLTLRAINS